MNEALIHRLEKTVIEVQEHHHPKGQEDFFCLNLKCWMAERMGPVLTIVREQQDRIAELELKLAQERGEA